MGDQDGSLSLASLLVRLVWPDPSASITYISVSPSRSVPGTCPGLLRRREGSQGAFFYSCRIRCRWELRERGPELEGTARGEGLVHLLAGDELAPNDSAGQDVAVDGLQELVPGGAARDAK